MARRYRKQGAGLATRIEQAELRVRVHETPQERQSRELLTRWLAESDDGAERWLEYGEMVATTLCAGDVLNYEHGRNMILSIVESLFALDTQRTASDDS